MYWQIIIHRRGEGGEYSSQIASTTLAKKNHPTYLIMMGAGKKGNKVVVDGYIEMDT